MEDKSIILEDIDELDQYLIELYLKTVSSVIKWWTDPT